MFGKLWKELWSFYAGHWWLFRITKTWSENRQQVENFQFLVSKLSIARQNAVSQRNNFLTDRNFIWFCGKNLGDTISLIKCSTVYCYENFGYIQKPVNSHFKLKWPCTEVWRGFRNYPYLGAGQEFYHISQMSSHEARTQTAFFHNVDKKLLMSHFNSEN